MVASFIKSGATSASIKQKAVVMIKIEDMKVAKLATAPDHKVVSVTHLQIDKENVTVAVLRHTHQDSAQHMVERWK